MSRRRQKHEEHENHERWLVSYADFLTLLFAFFVVMYSVSKVDTQKMIQASESLRWALSFEGTGGVGKLPLFQGPPTDGGCALSLSSGSNGLTPREKVVEQVRVELEKRLSGMLHKQEGGVALVVENGRLAVRLTAARFFDPAQAALRPDVLPLLDAVARELREYGWPVRIEAHTDEQVLRSGRFRDNWDLSATRAATVAAFLEQAHGFPPEDLTAAGMGAARPVAPNDTARGREQNRRVDLVLELPPGSALDAAAR